MAAPNGVWIRLHSYRSLPSITGRAGPAAECVVPSIFGTLFSREYSAELFGFVTITLPVSLYFAIMEASLRQATWGKSRARLKVVDIKEGKPLSLARSLGRTTMKFIPWELSHACIWYIRFHPESSWPFTIGIIVVFLLVGLNMTLLVLSRTHQTLYDIIAGTTVEMA